MSNTDLFKQAIAEAKTIREAAIANAKEALEESLTPHLKGMLAAKLQEMEEEAYEDEVVNEEDLINDPKGPTAHGNIAEEEEVEDEEVWEEAKEEAEEESEEEAEEEETPEEESEEEAEEEIDLENMTVEDLTDLIKSIVDQELGQEESGEEDFSPEGEEASDMVNGSDEEEIDINEILSELDECEEDGDDEHFELLAVGEPESKADYEGPEDSDDIQPAALALLKANPELTWAQAIAQAQAEAAPVEDEEVYEEAYEDESSDLDEALATVEELKTQLHEVNLLNAKLLYVNKIFKDNSLTESQKVNVVAAFDKAETVKEVKLVYETVSKNVTSKPKMVKEHKSFASKPVGATKVPQNTEIISEVSDTVKRLQKLAGIIK